MANSSEILEGLKSRPALNQPGVAYSFLVPNLKGLDTALSTLSPNLTEGSGDGLSSMTSAGSLETSPLDEISLFTAATETFSRKNINCSIAESLERFKPVIARARSNGVRVRAYISVVLGCPYEGPDVSPVKVAELTTALLDMGASEVSLGDTTGMGTAPRTRRLLQTLKEAGVRWEKLAVHFHDTFGQALVNVAVALEHGIRTFDSSVAGLGGCPYAKGATGNLASEDLVYFLHSMGLETGVDLDRLATVGDWISRELGRDNASRVGKAMVAKQRDAG